MSLRSTTIDLLRRLAAVLAVFVLVTGAQVGGAHAQAETTGPAAQASSDVRTAAVQTGHQSPCQQSSSAHCEPSALAAELAVAAPAPGAAIVYSRPRDDRSVRWIGDAEPDPPRFS